MKQLFLISAVLMGFAVVADSTDFVRHVRPEMGTMNVDPSARGCEVSNGNLYPLVMRPWGFGGWSPQTRAQGTGPWFYDYADRRFYGLRYTRQPSPWIGDHGAWNLLPVTDAPATNSLERFSAYSHKPEVCGPDHYRAYLADFDLTVELAPTLHGAVVKVMYPATEAPGLVVDPFAYEKGAVRLTDDGRALVGTSRYNANRRNLGAPVALHFRVELDRPAIAAEKLPDGALYVRFAPTAAPTVVTLRLANSFISDAQCRENLRESAGRTFEAVADEARTEWNDRLGRIAVQSADSDALRTFYTCFYRTMLFPQAVWEREPSGKIVHWSPSTGETRDGYYYAGTGFWDTFRALFPLLNLLAPEMNAKMMEGLQHCYEESGWLPEWSAPGLSDCMIGNNSASVVAEAWLAGVRGDFDINVLWQALVHGANAVHPKLQAVGRAGVEDYNRLGYVPRDGKVGLSAARTLEYAYDDWCLAELGAAIGRPADETAVYRQRAGNWRNVFDPARKIACGRNRDGSFNRDFDPFAWGGDFVEGCAHHYTWSVFHDVDGLMDAMGGPAAFERRLDEIFTLPPKADWSFYHFPIHEFREMQIAGLGQYAHGNQPIQHMIYLYDWCGAWAKAQRRVRQAMDRLYRPTPDGYCGDEDNGQTSAWYVWSALGMYPVCPGSDRYALGAPRFDEIRVTLPDGAKLRIAASGAEKGATFTSVRFGEESLAKPFVRRSQLRRGGTLQFATSD